MDRPRDHRRVYRFVPKGDALEQRRVLSYFWPYGSYSGSTNNFRARPRLSGMNMTNMLGELKSIELKSQATPAELLALRDDARAISTAASAADVPAATATQRRLKSRCNSTAHPCTDRRPMQAGGSSQLRVTTNLDRLDVPTPVVDQTLADMKALATSAHVNASEFQTFTNDFNTLRAGEATLPSNPYYHFEDPGLFYASTSAASFATGARRSLLRRQSCEVTLRRFNPRHKPDLWVQPYCNEMLTCLKVWARRTQRYQHADRHRVSHNFFQQRADYAGDLGAALGSRGHPRASRDERRELRQSIGWQVSDPRFLPGSGRIDHSD